MTIPTTTASPWPARCAYISAAIFTAASGLTNLNYGWQKGDTLATSLVWSGVAGAVAIVFALSWPALIRSVDARRWSAALISLVALALSGTYSITCRSGERIWWTHERRHNRNRHDGRAHEGASGLRRRQGRVGWAQASAPGSRAGTADQVRAASVPHCRDAQSP